jgi:hypothetical protein
MAPPYQVDAVPSAKVQLTNLYLKYRRLRYVAQAEFKIMKALEQNPQGGHLIPGSNEWIVIVLPLKVTYEIVGDLVRILSYEEISIP